ncbi:hypothetical protein ACJMK2_040357 [Sinanodonta woodiana]|uniref:Regulator of G-protein signaling 3 n=1 Tax=Sinanodonta woodiana TaxID=1069815 RepID=A0ABD3WFY4_SINWO
MVLPTVDEHLNQKRGCVFKKGHVKLAVRLSSGLLTVHVHEARQIGSKRCALANSFVRISLILDQNEISQRRTEVVRNSSNPVYDASYSFELTDKDLHKRLMISVWHQDLTTERNEFLGCTSFGIASVMKQRKDVNGWYYLLTEEFGRKKHLQITRKDKFLTAISRRASLPPVIPAINKDITGVEQVNLTVHRGKGGFGFTLVESCPVKVGKVDRGSRAADAGLREDDVITHVNGKNISRSTSTSVAKLVKKSGSMVTLTLIRNTTLFLEPLLSRHSSNGDHLDDADLGCTSRPNGSLTQPLLRNSGNTKDTRCQDAVNRLLNQDMDFVQLMHHGMQQYSRPLRHCILSQSQYEMLFQNIEKLVTISEYQIRQLQETMQMTSCDDSDTSSHSENKDFLYTIGMIYTSKLHLLDQAYTHYAQGVTDANMILSCLLRSKEFYQFSQNIPKDGRSLTLTTFIRQPLRHIMDIQSTLFDILQATPTDSPDHMTFSRIVEGLQPCIETVLKITRFNDINITSSEFECALLLKKIKERSSQKPRLSAPSASSLGLGSSLGSGSRTSGSTLSSGTSGMGSSMSSRCKYNDFIFHTQATEPKHYLI